MNKELMQIKIDGVDYSYSPDKAYLKNGNVYCKKCHEQLNGEVIEFLESKMIFTSKCRCDREQEELYKKHERAMKVKRLQDYCFTSRRQHGYTFDNSVINNNRAFQFGMNYVKTFDEMRGKNIGLLLCGSVGSGKSYLACAIANSVMEEYLYSCKMRNFAEIINDLQSGGFELDKNKYIESLTNVTLLVLDDLGMERDTAYALEQVYNVINSRSLKGKPTIITTNLTINQIKNSNDSLEYQRIYSRVLEMCIPIMVNGEDVRKKIHQDKLDDARQILSSGGGSIDK